jgi:hypothetical protein
VHLFGFIIRIYYDARPLNVKYSNLVTMEAGETLKYFFWRDFLDA